jgi:NAD(P)-dependent dehydrogenase (short-subunit alcohol dehydrogenase family)
VRTLVVDCSVPPLAGETAVITGGTTGLGFAATRRFMAEGARVLLTGHDAGRGDEAAAALGTGAVAARADVQAAAPADRRCLGHRPG